MRTDPRIDAYIAKAEPFAQPILEHLRLLIHKACPDVEETMKWSMPFFDYKGEMMCNFASFKKHCSFGFWKASLMNDPKNHLNHGETGMGDVGKIKALKDLPSEEVLITLIFEAMRLNDEGIKLPPKPKPEQKAEVIIPDYLLEALKSNKKAEAVFLNFSSGHKREYIAWFEEAKRDETRQKRIAQALEWISEGKGRNWKYQS